MEQVAIAEVRYLYLDLMKRVLTNMIYQDERTLDLQGERAFDAQARAAGTDWPSLAHTMIGLKRLENIQECVEHIIEKRIPGDLIETGVWRGGACIFMRAILRAYGVSDRTVWLADSFAGLPEPGERSHSTDKCLGSSISIAALNDLLLSVPMETVKENFSRYDLLDEQVRFLKGWFRETLPAAPIDVLALIRLDGDMYESTMDALTNLYPGVSAGGFVIVDDYSIESCREAVQDYRREHGIDAPLTEIDWSGVFWRAVGS